MLGIHRFLVNRWYINAVYYKVFVDAPLRIIELDGDPLRADVLQKVNTGGEALGLDLSGSWQLVR